ncbi:MAG: hypothetical protein R2850_03920 [Bacteroidia bacterium]
MKNFLVLCVLLPLLANAQNPSFEWVRGFQITGTNLNFSSIEDVAVDGEGNVISTGYFRGNNIDFDGFPSGVENANLSTGTVQSGFVQKMDADGTFLWAYKIGSGSTVRVFTMDLDAAGNIYCAGYFLGTNDFDSGEGVAELTSLEGADAFVLKLNADGTFAWVKQIGGSGGISVFCLALDGTEDITLTGVFGDTVDFDPGPGVSELTSISYSDIFITKLDSDGNFVWAKQIGSTVEGSGQEEELEHAVDGEGNILITGWFYSTLDFDPGPEEFNLTNTGAPDLFVLKLSPDGNFVWVKQASSSTTSGQVTGEGIDADAENNVYISGTFSSYIDFNPGEGITQLNGGNGDAFVLKLDANGEFVWVREIDGLYDIHSNGIAVAADGTSYSTGGFINTSDFDGGTGTFTLSSGSLNSRDAYVLKLDADGNFIWAGDMGSVGEDYGTAIYLDNDGNIACTGFYLDPGDGYPEMDFDPGPGEATIVSLASVPAGLFVLKLNQDGLPLGNQFLETNSGIQVYPNPTSGQIRINLSHFTGTVVISVFEMTGKQPKCKRFLRDLW